MKIDELKKKIGYTDIPIQGMRPQHDNDMCYVYGYPFQPMSYKQLKNKEIMDNEICKCQTIRQYLKDCNITN
ncbi:hypothetical protein [Phocaeicola plebeius]|uniref:hypothetical protein n=1 Tax=Phocaeicola plebeius TaxID=310297 RepID=UPI002011D19E|nr:hypothetical protein [Phocaeicola plebeius]MCL1613710.1 hypothetical protein [Phocaeicola plebeius]